MATEDGGYWHAFVPQFGYASLVGVGEAPDEALTVLDEAMRVGFEQLALDGEEPPPPLEQLVERPARSGKLTLRLPADLHTRLELEAEQAGLSLNAYLVSRLERAASEELTRRLIREELQKCMATAAAEQAPPPEGARAWQPAASQPPSSGLHLCA